MTIYLSGEMVRFYYAGQERTGVIGAHYGQMYEVEHPDGSKYTIEKKDILCRVAYLEWRGIADSSIIDAHVDTEKVVSELCDVNAKLASLEKIASDAEKKHIEALRKPIQYALARIANFHQGS